MTKIVVANLNRRPKAGGGAETGPNSVSVTEKRVLGTEGRVKTLRTLDARSRTFGDDFRYVFGKNVAKARRDNKRVIGSADVAPDHR